MTSQLITKSVEAAIEPVPDAQADDPNGEFNVILATPGTDREGDDLEGKSWQQPLPEHITFDTDHGMSVKTMVGSGTPTLQRDGSIVVKGSYASTSHAQDTRKLVNEKHIRTVSVTFLQRTTKSAGKTTVSRELLNGSFVAIPANPRAVILSSKSIDGATDAAQTAHDAAVQLGAACGHGKGVSIGTLNYAAAEDTAVTIVAKGIAGSIEDMTDRVRKAIRESYRDQRGYPYVRATFLDEPGKGTVVYEYESYGDPGVGGSKTLARSFTDDGKTTTLDATVREVSLVTSVVERDDDDQDDAAGTATKGVATDSLVERSIELLVKSVDGMTREAACELLGVDTNGDTVAPEATVEDSPADAAAAQSAAANADAAQTAASPAELRARALLLSLPDDAAG